MGTVDLSRVGTDFRKRYAGVRMQQGRVLSDDVFNNAECIDEEDMRRTRIDVIGPVGSPDSGFLPVVPAGPLAVPGKVQFSIAAGTLYLGGLRIEEPAAEPFHLQKDWVNFDIGDPNQWPDLPAAGTRVDLVWIEAWQQPVAAEEDSEKFEVSLGSADIDMNMRTMRRIMVSPGVKTDDCAVAWANALTAWSPALGTLQADMEIATSAKLQVTFTVPPDPGDLCSPATAGGYLGAENQAIRVQLVDATHFTWGFDNAAPLYRVQVSEFMRNGLLVTQLKLLSAPKDAVHWPLKDQVVEILPWSAVLPNREKLAELSGQLAKVTASYNPDDQTLEIDTSLATFDNEWKARTPADIAALFDGAPAEEYFFLRVWNRGDDLASLPAITITAGGNDLGNTGLHVEFTGGPLRANDYWIIGARPATPDAVVPWLLEKTNGGAPPDGVKRYRAPLGLIEWSVAGGVATGVVIDDCRSPFLPLTKLRGCCTVTVGDGVTSFGMYKKIQDAIGALPSRGGVVCVLPGVYNESVLIQGKHDIVIHGCDARSRVQAVADAKGAPLPAFLVVKSQDIGIERLGIEAGPRSAVEIQDSQRIAVRQCVVQMRDLPTIYQSIWVHGEATDIVIERNLIDILPKRDVKGGGPGSGVLDSPFDSVSPPPPLTLAHATRGGIQLGGGCERVRVLGNVIRGGIWNGITLGSVRIGGDDGDQPDQPGSEDPCEPCRPVDTGGGDGGGGRIVSAGNLYDIEIRDNRIEYMGANGISVVRFFALGKAPILVGVYGLHIISNLIRRCLRREIEPPKVAMEWLIGYGGIALAIARDLRICDNEIAENGVSHLEPICGVFALVVENVQIDRNRIRDNGPRINDEPASSAKPGTRGGVWIWLALVRGVPRVVQEQKLKRFDGVPAALLRDNIIIVPLGRTITLLALGTVDIARNRLVSQGTTGRDLEVLATNMLVGNFGISNEWTLGLLYVFLLMLIGKLNLPAGVDPCVFAKAVGLINFKDGTLWPPLTAVWPSGKTEVTENQISTDTIDQPPGFALSSILLAGLDDIAFTDNECEIESMRRFFLVDALVLAGSVRVADNRLAETWLHAFYSAWSIGLMNTTTDNQSTHCLRADAWQPVLRVFRDNVNFIRAFCPDECGRDEDPRG